MVMGKKYNRTPKESCEPWWACSNRRWRTRQRRSLEMRRFFVHSYKLIQTGGIPWASMFHTFTAEISIVYLLRIW